MRKTLTALAVVCMAATAMAGTWRPLSVFSGPQAGATWTCNTGSSVRPEADIEGRGPGVALHCRMSKVDDRCTWDADLRLDLSEVTELSFDIRLSEPSAVSRCTLYLRSGEGWYGGWFNVSGDGWQTVRLSRQDFSDEGNPSGWGTIDGARFAFWKETSDRVDVSIAGVRGRRNDIVVLRNSAAQATHPNEMALVTRASQRLAGWLNESGMATGLLDDGDIAAGVPDGCRVVILPYNPGSPPSSVQALRAFADRGGRLIVIYNLPEALAPILGLAGKDWMAAGAEQKFASIRFPRAAATGMPFAIRQDSWNASIPKITDATPVGFWVDGSGTLSDLPAVTLGRHGAFIGHLLTNIDRDRKVQLLLALIARLVPEYKPVLAQSILEDAARLSGTSSWEDSRARIMETAKTHDRMLSAIVHVDLLERYQAGSAGALEDMPFGDLLLRAEVTHSMVQDAYANAFSNCGIPDEFRGLWCHSAYGVPGRPWAQTAAAVKQAGFNALFPNVLWSGAAYYPSDVVPPAAGLGGRDLLAECLDACGKEDLEVHVWKVFWKLERAEESFVDQLRQANRLQVNAEGETTPWLCPSAENNRALERSAAVDVVSRYPVDGFHFDYIRYPGFDGCYCPRCHGTFEAAIRDVVRDWPEAVVKGNYRERFLQWRAERISSFVAETVAALRQARPDIEISAAVFSSWPSTTAGIGQDWGTWVKRGYLDFVCPMNYVTDADEARKLFERQVAAVGQAVPIYPGLGPSAKGLQSEQVLHQLDLIRHAGSRGFLLFELDRDLLDVHIPALRSGALRKK